MRRWDNTTELEEAFLGALMKSEGADLETLTSFDPADLLEPLHRKCFEG